MKRRKRLVSLSKYPQDCITTLENSWCKLSSRFKALLSLGFVLSVLSSCTSIAFRVITPISPLPSVDNHYPSADSLRPTFRWQPFAEATAYDLVIYESLEATYVEGLNIRSTRLVGKRIYFREGLKDTEHTIEEPLLAGRKYVWSVRAHQNDRVTSWATYSFGGPDRSGTNQFFGFETPS